MHISHRIGLDPKVDKGFLKVDQNYFLLFLDKNNLELIDSSKKMAWGWLGTSRLRWFLGTYGTYLASKSTSKYSE